MKTKEELIRTDEYWLVQIQNAFFKIANDFRKKHGYSQKQIAEHTGKSPGRISQILNGDFNARLSTLIEYSLAMGYVPEVKFTPIESYLQSERGRTEQKRDDLNRLQALVLDPNDKQRTWLPGEKTSQFVFKPSKTKSGRPEFTE